MSGACYDPFPMSFDDARKIILPLKAVAQAMTRLSGYRLDTTQYDVPCLSWHSGTDPMTIYIDRDLPEWRFNHALTKQTANCTRFLVFHEHVEAAVVQAVTAGGPAAERAMIALKMTGPEDELFLRAHGVATACELHSVWQSHGDYGCRTYCKFIAAQIKRASEKPEKVTPDGLDVSPD